MGVDKIQRAVKRLCVCVCVVIFRMIESRLGTCEASRFDSNRSCRMASLAVMRSSRLTSRQRRRRSTSSTSLAAYSSAGSFAGIGGQASNQTRHGI